MEAREERRKRTTVADWVKPCRFVENSPFSFLQARACAFPPSQPGNLERQLRSQARFEMSRIV